MSQLYELDVLREISASTFESFEYSEDSEPLGVRNNWRKSIDIYGIPVILSACSSDMMPARHKDWWNFDELIAKVTGTVSLPHDIDPALPLNEPEICVLIFKGYDGYGEHFLDWEFYVRDNFLRLPLCKRFKDALLAQKLRVHAATPSAK